MTRKSLLWISLIAMLIGSAAMVNTARAPISTTILVQPSITTALIGDYFTVDINIIDVLGLNAWEVTISWDSSILFSDKTYVTEGPFLKAGGPTLFNAYSFVSYIQVGSALMTPTWVDGSGTLVTIKFLVKTEGATPLHLYDTKLVDVDLAAIPHLTADGYFSNIVVSNLVGRSAWPEHHHFSIGGDEDGVQTLWAKVTNLGEGAGFVRANFTLWDMTGAPTIAIAKYMVGGVETRLLPGETVEISVDLWIPGSPWVAGKYYASATALYSATGTTWKAGDKAKSFSFAVVL